MLCFSTVVGQPEPRVEPDPFLPFRTLHTKDGLPHPRVERIFKDSNGFLWFCSVDALSIFDGVKLTPFTTTKPSTEYDILDVAEDRDGKFWVALWRGGLATLDSDTPQTEEPLKLVQSAVAQQIHPTRLLLDSKGTLWIGSGNGLFVLTPPQENEEPLIERFLLTQNGNEVRPFIWELTEDELGAIWIGTNRQGLFKIQNTASGSAEVSPIPCVDSARVFGISTTSPIADLFVATNQGLFACTSQGERIETEIPGSPIEQPIIDVFTASDGSTWFSGTEYSFVIYPDGRVRELILPDPYAFVRRFEEDSAGNIWLGTSTGGLLAWKGTGVSSWLEEDGLTFSRQSILGTTRSGQILYSSGDSVFIFRQNSFYAWRPSPLKGQDKKSISDLSPVIQTTDGTWWVGAKRGFFYGHSTADYPDDSLSFRKVDHYDLETYGRVRFLQKSDEQSVRVGTTKNFVLHVAAKTGVMQAEQAPDVGGIRRIIVTANQTVWVLGYGGVAQKPLDKPWNRLKTFDDNKPSDFLLRADSKLYIATRNAGLWVSKSPDDSSTTVEPVDTGIENLHLRTLAMDHEQQLYLGTHNGLYRYDPDTKVAQHFTMEAGISNPEFINSLSDVRGRLWLSSERGATMIDPGGSMLLAKPSTQLRIRDLRINGKAVPLSLLGVRDAGRYKIPPGPSQIEIELQTTQFQDQNTTAYQYRFSNAENTWSRPSFDPELSFAGLSPGVYELEFRVIRGGGASPALATASFVVLAPIYKRTWFIVLVLCIITAVVISFFSWRILQLKRLNQLRLRIATDLHDEIGSGLSQVAVLSEVAKTEQDRSQYLSTLNRMGTVSRNLVDSMSEIVWAINPSRDNPQDFVQRMRRFASDSLATENCKLDFVAEGWDGRSELGPHVRREALLILKECVHNIVKHASATLVQISLIRVGNQITLTVKDNGVGFNPQSQSSGLGQTTLQTRVKRLHGTLTITSEKSKGTCVQVSFDTSIR